MCRPGFARRLWLGRWRGMTPVGALVAVIVLVVIALGFAIWLQGRIAASNAVGAARKLVVLAQAVESHVRSEYGTYAALAAGTARQIDIGALRTDRLLPQGFDEAGDAMKRPLQAWAVSLGGGRVRLLSMQLADANDTRFPANAVFEARGRQALGLVDAAGRLIGPTVQEDVGAFRAAAGGHPRARALAVCALGRHVLVQRRRGRSWLRGHVPLGPGMAVGAALVLAVTALDRAGLGFG